MSAFLKSLKDCSEQDFYLEYLRTLRNSCREYMTRSRDEILPEQQKEWFNSLSDNLIPYVYIIDSKPSGYGIIVYQNDCAFLTAALEENIRGQGFGRKIFSDLIDIAKQKVNKICLEVLKSNTRARKLYESLGFVEVNRNDIVIFLEKEYDTSL